VSTRLKICGITTLKDALDCAELKVDYLGFNFFPGSPRFISYEKARSIIQKLPPETQSIGILVRPYLNDVLNIIEKSGVALVQIMEPQDFTEFSQIPVPVIITKRIKDTVRGTYELNGAHLILLDTYTADELGGSGRIFDWSMIPESIPRELLVLAGGITPDNVKEALDQVRPAVIDVASGAEIEPGIKDLNKVKRLVEITKYSELGNQS
jgi:phosphoribosylanthranilate isomerase